MIESKIKSRNLRSVFVLGELQTLDTPYSAWQSLYKRSVQYPHLFLSDMPVQHIEVNASTLKARSRVVLTEEEAQLLTKVHNSDLVNSTDSKNDVILTEEEAQLLTKVHNANLMHSTDIKNRVILTEEEVQLLNKVHNTGLVNNTDTKNSVLLTEEEAQLLSQQNSVALTTNAVTLGGDESTMYLVENSETGQLDSSENVYVGKRIETVDNQAKVMDMQPEMTSLLTSHIATEASQNPPIRKRHQIIVTSNQPQVQSILKQVAKERMTREVVTTVKSIQEEVSPASTPSTEHASKSPMKMVKLIRKQTPGKKASAGNSSVLHMKSLLPSTSKVPGNVKVVPPVVNRGTSIPVEGMQSLLKVNQRAAPQMVLRPDTLRKLKNEGVKGIRTRHILYVVPKVQDKKAQNVVSNSPEVTGQGQGKVMQSFVGVVSATASGPPQGVLNTSYSSYAENAQNSVSASSYVPLATSEMEKDSSQTHKSPQQMFILPCTDQSSPSKYIVKSARHLPAGCKILAIPMDSSFDSSDKLTAATTKSTVDTSAISGFIPDMTSPNKYSNSLLPDMEVPTAAYGTDEEKTRSEVDPYDIDKIIKDMEIGAGNPMNEQGLEFMHSMQSSPTDSILQVATAVQDQEVTGGGNSGSSLFQDQDVQLDATTGQHSSSLFQNQDSQLDATTSQGSDAASLFQNQNPQLDAAANQDTNSMFQNQDVQLDATTSQDTNSSSLFVNGNTTSSSDTQSSSSPTPSQDAYSMDWD